MANETELGGKTGDSQPSGISGGVNDDVNFTDDCNIQLKPADLIMPGVLMTAILAILGVLILLGIAGCASSPSFPPAGPQQKTSAVVVNPNCVTLCSAQVSQSTALEDIKNNQGPVTGGTQSQSTTQTSTQTAQPAVTTSKTDDGEPKP